MAITQEYFSNNVSINILAGFSSLATNINITSGQETLLGLDFPQRATVEEADSDGNIVKREIVRIDSVVGNQLTVTRAIEDCPQSDTATTQTSNPLNFSSQAYISLRLTAEQLGSVYRELSDQSTSDIVFKTGTQTITGDKIFTGQLVGDVDSMKTSTTNAPTLNDAVVNKKYVDDQIAISSTPSSTGKEYVAAEGLTAGDAVYNVGYFGGLLSTSTLPFLEDRVKKVWFNNNGTRAVVLHQLPGIPLSSFFSDMVLSTPYDLNSNGGEINRFDTSSQSGYMNSFIMNSNGTKILAVSPEATVGGTTVSNKEIHEYTLSTGFDVGTISYDTSLSIASEVSNPYDIEADGTGNRVFICDSNNGEIDEYSFSNPYTISSVSYTTSYSLSPKSFFFNDTGSLFYAVYNTSVVVYSLTTNYDLNTRKLTNSRGGIPNRYERGSFFDKKVYVGTRTSINGYKVGVYPAEGVAKTDASDIKKIDFIGFADSTVTAGSNVLVNFTYDDNQSGLNKDNSYFLGGELSTSTSLSINGTQATNNFFLFFNQNNGDSGNVTPFGQTITIPDVGQRETTINSITFFGEHPPFAAYDSYTLNLYFDIYDNSNSLVATTSTNTINTSVGNPSPSSELFANQIATSVTLQPGQYKIMQRGTFLVTSGGGSLLMRVVQGTADNYTGGEAIDGSFNPLIGGNFVDLRFNLSYTDTILGDGPGTIVDYTTSNPQVYTVPVGVADSETSINIINKKQGGRIAKGTTTGASTVVTGFYPVQVIYSDTNGATVYLDENAISNKTQSGFDIGGAFDRVARG